MPLEECSKRSFSLIAWQDFYWWSLCLFLFVCFPEVRSYLSWLWWPKLRPESEGWKTRQRMVWDVFSSDHMTLSVWRHLCFGAGYPWRWPSAADRIFGCIVYDQSHPWSSFLGLLQASRTGEGYQSWKNPDHTVWTSDCFNSVFETQDTSPRVEQDVNNFSWFFRVRFNGSVVASFCGWGWRPTRCPRRPAAV